VTLPRNWKGSKATPHAALRLSAAVSLSEKAEVTW
jgi:hypothetical protein